MTTLKKLLSPLILFFSILLLLNSCGEKTGSENSEKESSEKVAALVASPKVNPDSMYAFVDKQVSFGPRVPGTEAHTACGNWLVSKMGSYGMKVSEQVFDAYAWDGTKLPLRNIVASYNSTAKSRVMLAAHWDSRPIADKDDERKNEPIMGANDGGSGVAVLLEVARILSMDSINIGVDFFFFDGEDYGTPLDYQGQKQIQYSGYCLGSLHWAQSKHAKFYKARYGILFDMVGAKDARFFQEGFSMKFAPEIVKKVWGIASRTGYSPRFIPQQAPEVTDDHVPVNKIAKIPMIDIIEFKPDDKYYFGSYHHTHDDNMDIIDKETLRAVGNVTLAVLWNE